MAERDDRTPTGGAGGGSGGGSGGVAGSGGQQSDQHRSLSRSREKSHDNRLKWHRKWMRKNDAEYRAFMENKAKEKKELLAMALRPTSGLTATPRRSTTPSWPMRARNRAGVWVSASVLMVPVLVRQVVSLQERDIPQLLTDAMNVVWKCAEQHDHPALVATFNFLFT
jgi:hypothetical protein